MRLRDFWHRKEEIDPSLGSAKQFAEFQSLSPGHFGARSSQDEQVVNVLVDEAWPPHHRFDLTKQAGLSNQCPAVAIAFIEGARFGISISKQLCGLHSAECVDIDNESNQVP